VLDDDAAPRSLTLPPPYTAHWLSEGDVFEEACRRAEAEGAGCLVWHTSGGGGRAGRLDFAVVLEPETRLSEARRAFVIGMVALGDALAAEGPPERAVGFVWPGEVTFDGGRIGGMRLAVAPGTDADAVPDWMVIGVELIADRDHLSEPGGHPDSVSLKEEEFADPPAIVESFAAYLMLNFDRWKHDGFASVASRYAARLGSGAALTEDGDLKLDDGVATLEAALTVPAWRGESGPRL
jgi:biotin-(acetyl-CoA carboxylase) ligase